MNTTNTYSYIVKYTWYKRFINFCFRFFDTRRETQFLPCWLYYLTPHHTWYILWCLRSLSVEICKTPTTCLSSSGLNSLCPNGRDSIVYQHCPISNPKILNTMVGTPISQHHGRTSTSQHHGQTSTESFSKSSKFSTNLFWAWCYPHSSPIYDCHILCMRV